MAIDWAAKQAFAQRMIDKFGQDVTLRRIQPIVPHDPLKPWAGRPSVPVDETVTMVFLQYDQQYVDGTVIQTGDLQVFMAGEAGIDAPTLKDVVIRNGVKWNIVSCSPFNPAGTDVFYELQVRR